MKAFIRRLVEEKLLLGVAFLVLNAASGVNGLFSFLRNGSFLSLVLSFLNFAVAFFIFWVIRKALKNRLRRERRAELRNSLTLNKADETALTLELLRLRGTAPSSQREKQLQELEKLKQSVEQERLVIEDEISKL